MPLYDYIDKRTGKLVEIHRPIDRRDCVPPHLKRVVFGTAKNGRVNSFITGAIDPTSADAAIPRALKEMEATMSHQEICRQAGWSAETLKQTWKI